MTTIDLNWLESKDACEEGITYFKDHFTEIDAKDLIDHLLKTDDTEKIRWANWIVTSLLDHKQCVRYAVYAEELVLPIFENEYPNDKRYRAAIYAAKDWVDNQSEINREAAKIARNAAALAAYSAAYSASYAAALAARAANYTNYTYDYKKTLIDIVSYGVGLL